MCGRTRLNVNVNQSKVMQVSESGEYGALNVQLNGEKMKELDCFGTKESVLVRVEEWK